MTTRIELDSETHQRLVQMAVLSLMPTEDNRRDERQVELIERTLIMAVHSERLVQARKLSKVAEVLSEMSTDLSRGPKSPDTKYKGED